VAPLAGARFFLVPGSFWYQVPTQVPDSSPPPAARVLFPVGLAAAAAKPTGNKNLLRTTAGGEES